jgi:tetratricopeptide (TPR) repeat protein
MRKRAFLIPIFTLVTALALYGAIAWAGPSEPESKDILEQANDLSAARKYDDAEKLYLQVKAENPGSAKALEAQKQIISIAIAQKDQVKADTSFNQMVTDFAEIAGLDEAVYEVGKDYQYSSRNTEKANQTHNYNLEHFPQTKYGMLSNVEIICSYLRDDNKIANSEYDKWLNKYKGQPDQAMGIYQIAGSYVDNNKAAKGLELYQYAIDNHSSHVYGKLSKVSYNSTTRDYDAADTAADDVAASFSDNDAVKERIRELADFYMNNDENARAAHFYRTEIDNWLDYDQPAVTYQKAIYCYINMKDVNNADALISKMQTDLTKDPQLARTNFERYTYVF